MGCRQRIPASRGLATWEPWGRSAVRAAHGHTTAGASARDGTAQSLHVTFISFRWLLEQIPRENTKGRAHENWRLEDGEHGTILRWFYSTTGERVAGTRRQRKQACVNASDLPLFPAFAEDFAACSRKYHCKQRKIWGGGYMMAPGRWSVREEEACVGQPAGAGGLIQFNFCTVNDA